MLAAHYWKTSFLVCQNIATLVDGFPFFCIKDISAPLGTADFALFVAALSNCSLCVSNDPSKENRGSTCVELILLCDGNWELSSKMTSREIP